MKPKRWSKPDNKLFPHQVGFTAPPHDFDAAPADFLRIAPETVGVHGRLLHVETYSHELKQRAANFHLLEEVVHCMSNAGADVVGQVGTNWVHCNGTNFDDIVEFCDRVSGQFETPFHMAGMCLVEGLRELNISKVALNSGYFWPEWRDGVVRFLRSAGINVVYAGNVVDLGLYQTQKEVNDLHWILPGDLALESMLRTLEKAPDVDAVVLNGMPNWRRADGLPQRTLHLVNELEAAIGKPIVSSDFALYWRIFKTLSVVPMGKHGQLMSTLSALEDE
jgi:maleate cis-trans isomerase